MARSDWTPHVQVVVDEDATPARVIAAIQATGARASFTPLRQAFRGGLSTSADAIVFAASDEKASFEELARLSGRPRSTFLVRSGGGRPGPSTASPMGVVEPAELPARLADLFGPPARSVSDRCTFELARRRLAELRRARRAQKEFLPRALPRFGPVRFSAVFRPLDCVSGDIYDVRRLDDEHVALSVVDAEGHGLPAALLTVFIRRALEGREPTPQGWRILDPADVLRRMNRALIQADFKDCQYIVAAYALLNLRTRRAVIARGGTPYPILRRADGECRFVRGQGSMLGVDIDTVFTTETIQLSPGDSLLLYSDGVEQLYSPAASEARDARPDEWLATTEWHRGLREHGPDAAITALGERYDALRAQRRELDDLTAVAVCIDR